MNEVEEIERLDELAQEVRIARLEPAPASLPAARGGGRVPVRTASALAAGGFLAGAALVGITRRQRRPGALVRGAGRRRLPARRLRRRAAAKAPAAERLQILATHRVLLDVHLLGPLGPDS